MFRALCFLLCCFMGVATQANTLTTQVKSRTPRFKAGVDTSYFDFYGRHPADGNLYGFQQVFYSVQNFQFTYLATPTLHFSVQAKQIRNYAETNFLGVLYKDTTQGLGDTKLSATKTFFLNSDLLIANLGLSLPTGSVSEKNKNNPQFNYPYNMQLGSGTVDLEPSLMFLRTQGQNQWGAFAMGVLRNGRNSYGYRKGNEYIAKIWYSYLADSLLMPGLWLNYHHIQRLSGVDSTYGRNPFVEFYHSPRHFWDFTANINSQYDVTRFLKLKATVGRPIWQESKNIDNVQVYMDWFAQLGLEGQF